MHSASAQGLFRSRVRQVLGPRLTPTLEFIPDALPEARQPWRMPREGQGEGRAIAAAAQGATCAGEEDPYRHDDAESRRKVGRLIAHGSDR